MNLLIYNYNNYYNRMYKAEETLAEYGDPIHVLLDVKSFKPNNGVNTQHAIGSSVSSYDGTGDYLICTDEFGEILSRWFIIDSQFNRENQWIVSLHRDLVADYYDKIVNVDCQIEKAILPSWNKLTLNQEDITVNQIKTDETLLKDETEVAWIVGYYNNKPQPIVDTNGNPTDEVSPYLMQLDADDKVSTNVSYDVAITDAFEDWFGEGIRHANPSGYVWEIYSSWDYNYSNNNNRYLFSATGSASKFTVDEVGSGLRMKKKTTAEEVVSAFTGKFDTLKQTSFDYLHNTEDPPMMTEEETQEFLSLNNRIVRFGDGIVRRITISSGPREQATTKIKANSNLYTYMYNRLSDAELLQRTSSAKDNNFGLIYTRTHYEITATPVAANTDLTVDIPVSVRQLNDASYNMFAMPYPIEGETFTLGGKEMTQDLSMKVATALANKYSGGGVLYDLQLLPFCPIFDIDKVDTREYDLPTDESGYSAIKNYDDEIVGYILHAKQSQFTFNININLSCENMKMENQTDMYRLCSPNFNGQFEFNLAKNGGSINYFNVDCTYLPYNPYIHINPSFDGLYGQDFDDARGLICGGDFSLPIMNDAWESYQLQNKNYLNSFNRGIEKMEKEREYGRATDMVSAIFGALQGGVSGAFTANAWGAGGLVSGLAGIGGAGLSLAGGLLDARMNDYMRQYNIDYTKDMFNFNLGNIQALPQSIAKTTAYTYNNKVFPLLEYYTCTDEEKEAFANKVAYNSMSVGTIGKISDYIGNTWSYTINNKTIESKGYIKGKIIRVLDIDEKTGIINAIGEEIYKGVYF